MTPPAPLLDSCMLPRPGGVHLQGSCQCGSVRYEIAGRLQRIGNCHCSICRKSNGAAYVTWGIIAPEQFRWTAGEALIERYPSSADRDRCFCRKCGSSLASSHAGQVGEVVLGTLDDDPGARPQEHIFVNSKAIWHEITDDLPQHAEWPSAIEA